MTDPSASRYYDTDPGDPEAPVALGEYHGIHPSDHVVYENPAWRQPDGSYRTGGMDPPLVVDAIHRFPGSEDLGDDDQVLAIINGGEWEVNADNLRRVEPS